VTLDPDEQAGGTLTWDTTGETVKTYDVCVVTDDREACLTVEVQSSVSVVDNFEDNDISEYGGDTGNFAAKAEGNVSVSAQNGTTVLEGDSPDGSFYGISSTSGLNAYPSQGDTFRCWVYLPNDSGVRTRIYYGTQSETNLPNRYMPSLDDDVDEFQLQLQDDSGFSIIASTSHTFSLGAWYEVEVDWGSSDTHTVRLLDDTGTELEKISTTDTTYTSGGIGFQHNPLSNSSSTAFFDYYRIL
jgi:hypothetical protein